MPAKWQKWMPFHIDSFYGSPWVQAMHPAAQSGYLKLLAAQWQTDDCTLPADDEDLAILSGLGGKWDIWKDHSKAILRHFSKLDDGRIRNNVCFGQWTEAKRVFEARRTAADKTNARSPHGHRTPRKRSPSRSADTGTHTQTKTVTETEEQKPKATPLSDKSDPTRPEEFANSWNRLRGSLAKVMEFTDSRRKKVQVRQRQGISLEAFEKAVSKCASIPFLSGDNKQGWKADFDWLLDNDKNLLKVLEGKYEAGKPDADETLGELIRQRRETSRMADGNAIDGLGFPQA